jgi:hypothetical protein
MAKDHACRYFSGLFIIFQLRVWNRSPKGGAEVDLFFFIQLKAEGGDDHFGEGSRLKNGIPFYGLQRFDIFKSIFKKLNVFSFKSSQAHTRDVGLVHEFFHGR